MKSFFPHLFEWVDLSHPLHSHVPSWEGGCGFTLKNVDPHPNERNDEKSFLLQEIAMSAGIGTHLDSPFHYFPQGLSVDQMQVKTLIVPSVTIDLTASMDETTIISIDTLIKFEKENTINFKESFVIFSTGWGKYWNDPNKYRNNLQFPTISKEVADYLVKKEIVGIGIDTLSPDLPNSDYPVHKILLGNGKYIVENVANLNKMKTLGYVFILPLPIVEAAEAPVRMIGCYEK